MAAGGPLDYMTDDELHDEWTATLRDKHAAIEKLRGEMAWEQQVLAIASDRGLTWSRQGRGVEFDAAGNAIYSP